MLDADVEWDVLRKGRHVEPAAFERIHEATAEAFGCGREIILSRRRSEPVAMGRNGFVILACMAGHKEIEVAEWLKRHVHTVEKSFAVAKNRHQTEKTFRKLLREAAYALKKSDT